MSQETSTFCVPIHPPLKSLEKTHTKKTPALSLDPILTLFIFLAYQVSLIIQIFYGKDSVVDDDDDDCFMVTGHRGIVAIKLNFLRLEKYNNILNRNY